MDFALCTLRYVLCVMYFALCTMTSLLLALRHVLYFASTESKYLKRVEEVFEHGS